MWMCGGEGVEEKTDLIGTIQSLRWLGNITDQKTESSRQSRDKDITSSRAAPKP